MDLFLSSGDPLITVAQRLREVPLGSPRRATVLLPSERHAHALRRLLCAEWDEAGLLAGARLRRPVDLAREVVVRGGQVCGSGWETIRRARIARCFDPTTPLAAPFEYFELEQLQGGRGYAEAFARTIGDLEESGIERRRLADLVAALRDRDAATATRLHDVGIVWNAVDGCERHLFSRAEILQAAAHLVRETPALATCFGPVIALLVGSPSIPLLRFLEALPQAEVVLPEARPLRTGTQRWRRSLPKTAPKTARKTPEEGPSRTAPWLDQSRPRELTLVQRYLFEIPEILTDPSRPRSGGADGSVLLEEHASAEEEVEAAASWVAERLRHGAPIERMAILVPDLDPYAGLLLDRLQRLGQGASATIPVHVAGGLPMASSPAGLRLLALLRCLRRGLDAESTIRLLPWLRHPNEGDAEAPMRLTPSKAARLVYDAGIVGGTSAGGTGEWVERLQARRTWLDRLIAETESPGTGEHQGTRQQQHARRLLKDIDRVLPAISALQGLALGVQNEQSVAELWPAIRDYCQRWLRLPPHPPNPCALLDEALAPLLADDIAETTRGRAALTMLGERIATLRLGSTRYGEPALFLGTAQQACGLSFDAVRILGMAEGLVPHTVHDDPILPDASRAAIEAAADSTQGVVVLPRLADQVLEEIHDVFQVAVCTREQLALSVPRQSLDRGEREVSGVVLEIATALSRGGSGGAGDSDVPSTARLRSAYFHDGATPAAAPGLSPKARLGCIDAGHSHGLAVPADWVLPGACSLARVTELRRREESLETQASDGFLTAEWSPSRAHGLAMDRPLSATALRILLDCPHRFLLERLLFWKEPARRPPTDTIDPIAYGNLLHSVAERFWAANGAALCKHDEDEKHWVERGRALASQCFEEQVGFLPLRGGDTIERERTRLMNQMEQLVRYEWSAGSRNYYASELTFGDPKPVALASANGTLFLRGAIDRVDQVGNAFHIRDLKTGRVHELQEEPINPSRDVQLGVYVLVLETLRLVEEAEVALAAYVHPSAAQEPDRRFVGGELEALRKATLAWLDIAAGLLREGLFPRTPDIRDCTFCPFAPACTPAAPARSGAKLSLLPNESAAARYLRLKRQRPQEG